MNTPVGTSLEETERVTQGAMEEIQRIEGVKSVTRRTGRAERDEHAEPVSASELLVRVDMQADPLKLRNAINGVIRQIPAWRQ